MCAAWGGVGGTVAGAAAGAWDGAGAAWAGVTAPGRGL